MKVVEGQYLFFVSHCAMQLEKCCKMGCKTDGISLKATQAELSLNLVVDFQEKKG